MVTLDLSEHYQPHEGQQQVHDSAAKVKVLRVGRRWGKSRFALWELIKCFAQALTVPAQVGLVPPFHAWVVAPSYPQARQVWNEVLSFLPREFYGPGDVHQDERMVYLKGSAGRAWGLLEIKSAHEPDSLQTAGLDFLWVTEAQDVSDAAFQKLLPTLRSPGRMAYAVYEGIPAMYPTHWFERAYRSSEEGREGYAAFSFTSFQNPLLSEYQKLEIEADRELLPDRAWRRMYLAEFSEDSGYFSNVLACVVGDLLPMPIPGAEYVAGLDLGRKLDPSVLTIMDGAERRVVHHISWDKDTDWVLQRERVVRVCREWGVERLVVDASSMGGDLFAAELIEAGLPVEPYIFTWNSREALLQGMAVAMERHTVQFPGVPSLLRQLRAFQFIRLPSGKFRPEAPPGEHDDEVFALALALTACQDAPGATAARRLLSYNPRYVPTQEEATVGLTAGLGARMARARRVEKVRERQDRAGVT